MPNTEAGRDLLYGALALRLNLIDARGLDDALRAWAADPSRPLRPLVRARLVPGADAYRLDALTDREFAAVGGDGPSATTALGRSEEDGTVAETGTEPGTGTSSCARTATDTGPSD